MRKLVTRLAAALALIALASPAPACEGMKTTTASSSTAKPVVASNAAAKAGKAAKPDGKAAPSAKPTATN